MAEQDKGQSDSHNIQAKLDRALDEIQEKNRDIAELERANKQISGRLYESQKKANLAVEREQKLSQNLKPKLQQAVEQQKTLF